MIKRIFFVYGLILLLASSCIEPYDFTIVNNEAVLVVQGQISNVSYNETLNYPSDGRFFQVKLRETQDVTNISDNPVSNAQVTIQDDQNNIWCFTENAGQPGDYILFEENFKADIEKSYKLVIRLESGEQYESSWETVHQSKMNMGEINFQETDRYEYEYKAAEKKISQVFGINIGIDIPKNDDHDKVYFRWDMQPTWVYIAPLALATAPDKVCWAKNELYLKDYETTEVINGDFTKDLAFVETFRNERLFTDFSLLVIQQSLSEDYYYFWKEMKKQSENKGIFEAPPFNLKSNLTCVNDKNKKVIGYFGVVEEQAKRWYFNIKDLSYNVQNTLRPDCEVVYGPDGPAAECTHCQSYTHGRATVVPPKWWPYKY